MTSATAREIHSTTTPAQRRALLRLSRGNFEHAPDEYPLTRASRERMYRRLCKLGLAQPYPHGGFEITDWGRQYVRHLEQGGYEPARRAS